MKASLLATLCVFCSINAAAADFSNTPILFDDAPVKSMFFYEAAGWFVGEKRYPIRYFDSVWHWRSGETWVELNTPYVGTWNSHYHVILDRGGKIYVSAKDNGGQWEIRWRNGEWEENASGDWTSLAEDRYEESLDRQ